ncbi:DUF4114 domain-containing protein [Pseudobowmanella zhangzhouensis]|uniref:DUF4114 domain-containing protein n=1 Tax=Pseudobowmanella zhangzhouensis TaxID=1537679 RepID=A0ABW1XGX9_9ALTE
MKNRLALSVMVVCASSLSAYGQETPDNLTSTELDPELLKTVTEALPESYQVNAAFLSDEFNPNITFSEDAQMAITFVDEGAGFRNSVGYFNFEAGAFDNLSFGDIDLNNNGIISIDELSMVESVNVGMIFNNFSEAGGGGTLQVGDTTVIGGGSFSYTDSGISISDGLVFEAGTTTGFFVIANAWNGTDVNTNLNTFYTLDFLNPENDASATLTNYDDNARHVAMMFATDTSSDIIVGFEDLLRPYGDNDFNDAIFIVQTDPYSAVSANKLPIAAAPMPGLGSSLGWLWAGLFIWPIWFQFRPSTPRKSA